MIIAVFCLTAVLAMTVALATAAWPVLGAKAVYSAAVLLANAV